MFRIISGKFKGRKFKAPSTDVRPTTDFAKESLFNILQNHGTFHGKNLLDLYAGTGSISLEFISRGGKSATVVEHNSVLIKFLRETTINLNIVDNFRFQRNKVDDFLNKCSQTFDFIFADPPFSVEDDLYTKLHQVIFEKNLLTNDGILILEHSSKKKLEHLPFMFEHRTYGAVGLSFFKRIPNE